MNNFNHSISLNYEIQYYTNYELLKFYKGLKKVIGFIIEKNSISQFDEKMTNNTRFIRDELNKFIKYTLSSLKLNAVSISEYVRTWKKTIEFADFVSTNNWKITKESIESGFDKTIQDQIKILLTVDIKFSDIWIFLAEDDKDILANYMSILYYYSCFHVKMRNNASRIIAGLPVVNLIKSDTRYDNHVAELQRTQAKDYFIYAEKKLEIPRYSFKFQVSGRADVVKKIVENSINKNACLNDEQGYSEEIVSASEKVIDRIVEGMTESGITRDSQLDGSADTIEYKSIVDMFNSTKQKLSESVDTGECTKAQIADVALSLLKDCESDESETSDEGNLNAEYKKLISTIVNATQSNIKQARQSRNTMIDPTAKRLLNQIKKLNLYDPDARMELDSLPIKME